MSNLPPPLFARLAPSTRVGDVVRLDQWPGWWRVETAHLADDLRDTKCTLVFAGMDAPAAGTD